MSSCPPPGKVWRCLDSLLQQCGVSAVRKGCLSPCSVDSWWAVFGGKCPPQSFWNCKLVLLVMWNRFTDLAASVTDLAATWQNKKAIVCSLGQHPICSTLPGLRSLFCNSGYFYLPSFLGDIGVFSISACLFTDTSVLLTHSSQGSFPSMLNDNVINFIIT